MGVFDDDDNDAGLRVPAHLKEPMPAVQLTLDEVEESARTWVHSVLTGGDVQTIETARLRMLRRGGKLSRTDWAAIADRVANDYIGPASIQRAFVHSAIVRVLSTAMALTDAEELEPKDRIAAGRLSLEAIKNLAALSGVGGAERVEVEVTVTGPSEEERMSDLLARINASIVEARAVEVVGEVEA